jgi:transposase-like protein
MKVKRLPQKDIVLDVIENLLKDGLIASFGASRYERSTKRRAYQNGLYERSVLIRFGLIEDIGVLRIDRAGINFTVFDR